MFAESLYSLINTLLLIIKEMGYLGIFIGMTIESSFFPLPSEIILIPAGALIAKGELNFFLVFILGVLGSLLGAWINYFLAFFLGRKTVDYIIAQYGKFIFLNKEKLKKIDIYFNKNGEVTTFIGRLIPLVRHLISLPAGFAKMNFGRFSLFTCLGAGIWVLVLMFTGMFFGSNAQPITKIITSALLVLSAAAFAVYYIVKNKRKKQQ